MPSLPKSKCTNHDHPSCFSTSPPSVTSPIYTQENRKLLRLSQETSHDSDENEGNNRVTLEEFIELIPSIIRKKTNSSNQTNGSDDDPITQLFRRMHLSKHEQEKYTFLDPNKKYTRNLIATDHETFTLLLLCWNPNKYSPIHDHPCDGCWMKVLHGSVNEKRYRNVSHVVVGGDHNQHHDRLVCTSDLYFTEGQDVFIKDSLGYHKIGNHGNEASVTLHLYSPPISKCRLWMSERSTSSTQSYMCNFSEYGKMINHTNSRT